MFSSYFWIFPWEILSPDPEGFDLGCGSGRWARGVAPRVGKLHCIDASQEALLVARENLRNTDNVVFHAASVDDIPLADGSMDFGYCLGVLHHVPDTWSGLRHAVSKLRRGAPFLLYLYYSFDNQPWWYAALWRASDGLRRMLSRMPLGVRYASSQLLAATVYFPLARTASVLDRFGFDVRSFPLSSYRRLSFYSMRTDALDRFGTRLEKRFTRQEITKGMLEAGLTDIVFSDRAPYWCAVGVRS
jgi:SAM-dependent methyltransferase